jgi:hypothetical protein
MRCITGRTELELFCQLPYVLNNELSDDLETGRRRPAWMWIAIRGDRVLARVAWWGNPEEKIPQVLDVVDSDDSCADINRTRVLTRHNVPRIRASTDLSNVPMAVAFERAGWDNFERTINMTW